MHSNKVAFRLVALIFIFVNAATSFAQTLPPVGPSVLAAAPWNMSLPDGYIYERRRGIDTSVGSLKRSDGFEIKFDVGRMAGNYAGKYFPEYFEMLRQRTHLNVAANQRDIDQLQNQVIWRQKQTIGGQEVVVVMLKESRLIATFPSSSANFMATADSSDKIADFLLIVLTFRPTKKPD